MDGSLAAVPPPAPGQGESGLPSAPSGASGANTSLQDPAPPMYEAGVHQQRNVKRKTADSMLSDEGISM